MERRLSWALTAAGVLGLVSAITILPLALMLVASRVEIAIAGAKSLYALSLRTPLWLQWQPGSTNPGTVGGAAIVMVASVLLIVASPRAPRVAGILGLVWLVALLVVIDPSGYPSRWSSVSGSLLPLTWMLAISVPLVAYVSVTALMTAARMRSGV